MHRLRLIIQCRTFLPGMKCRNTVDKLALHIFNSLLQVTQIFRLQSHYCPYMRRLYKYLVAEIDFIIFAMLLNQIVKHMAGVTTVSRHSHTTSQKDNPCLLGGNIDAASPPFISGETAFAVSAEAAQIAHRRIEGLIGFH